MQGRTPSATAAGVDEASYRTLSSIETRINVLSNGLIATATATFGEIGLGFLQARILLALSRQADMRAADLCKGLKIDAAAVSRAVKDLRDGGLAAEVGLQRRLRLTDAGLRLAAKARAIAEERERRLLKGLSDAEADLIRDRLESLLGNTPDLLALAEGLDAFLSAAQREPDTD
jgi:DNA-binding MarR family transcriptional regulator